VDFVYRFIATTPTNEFRRKPKTVHLEGEDIAPSELVSSAKFERWV